MGACAAVKVVIPTRVLLAFTQKKPRRWRRLARRRDDLKVERYGYVGPNHRTPPVRGWMLYRTLYPTTANTIHVGETL